MRIKANEIEVHYELSGKEDAPVAVLSHSLASSLAMWDPQMAVLEPHFRVLRYDTRGHGETEAPPLKYTLDMLADDALCLLDAVGVDRVHWVGLSMGGMIGQCIALKHAERLKSLSLCDTAAVMHDDNQPVWQEHIDTARNLGMLGLLQNTMGRWFTTPYRHKNPPAVQLIQKHFLKTPVPGYIGCSEAIRVLNYLDQISRIRLPTLILVGEEDPGTPVSASQAMHERIPDSRLVILPSAAHMSNVEQPEAFNRALLKFLLEAANS